MDVKLERLNIEELGIGFDYTYEIVKDEMWFQASTAAKMLSYVNTNDAVINLVDGINRKTVHIDNFTYRDGSTARINSDYVFINKNGLIQLVIGSKLILSESKRVILESLGVAAIVLPRDTRELEFFEMLKSFVSFDILTQYRVDEYLLDGYIPELNIAIEYNEEHHNYYEQAIYDRAREDYVIKKLGCKFIRLSYTLDNKTNVERVLKFINGNSKK